jgi:tetratricopeptide (TPR) repeat protein
MTSDSWREGILKSDARYQEGLAHLQAGEWEAAIRRFEELAREFAGSPTLERLLEEARFKANLDATARVKPKRWSFSLRGLIVRGVIAVIAVLLVLQGVQLFRQHVAPALAQVQLQWQMARLLREADARLQAGDLDGAEQRFRQLLALEPNSAEAQEGLKRVAEERTVLARYQEALRLEEAGDYGAALRLYTDILVQRPQYRDVSLRVENIRRRQQRDALFAAAEEDYQAGRLAEAAAKYEQLRTLDVNFERELITQRLFELYMRMGRALVERDPPATEVIPTALELFTKALALVPRSSEAALEQQLASAYLDGQAQFQQGNWEAAIARLKAVFDQRPDYLHGLVTDTLYEAYIRSGDAYRDAGDFYFAYERYRAAAALPVADTALARGRMFSIEPLLTPTATPTNTRTPTPTATSTPYPTITPIPSATATATPVPLWEFRNQIVFFSDNEEQPGLWVMDPNGENRRYLGDVKVYREQYNQLWERESLSPDGRYRAYVAKGDRGNAQIFIAFPPDPTWGELPPKQLTLFTGISYDPVWSPDGSRIAFVSQENGSDDIWVIYTDGKGARALTRNTWEWDKHPSWSPDGTRIVFWSNRTGTKNIFIMDAGGENVQNISNTPWDEYDPIWVK